MTSSYSPPAGKKFYLFGYPVAHSAAPTLHNHSFTHWPNGRAQPNTYEIWSTSQVTNALLQILSSDDCGGAASVIPQIALTTCSLAPKGDHAYKGRDYSLS